MAKKSKSRRTPLDRERILRAAVAFADKNGVEALTMRELAKRLGFGVMSLYNHVANKDEVLEGMADFIAGEIVLPTESNANWKETIRSCASSAHEILLKHRWAAKEWSCRLPGPCRTRFMEWILKVLSEEGLSPDLIYHGFHAVCVHIVGFTQQEIGYDQMFGSEFDKLTNEFLDTMSSTFPHLAEHARGHLERDCDENEFGIVLDLILEGIESANTQR